MLKTNTADMASRISRFKISQQQTYLLIFNEHIIVESILYWRSIAQATAIHPLHCFTQYMCCWMPEHLLPWQKEWPNISNTAQFDLLTIAMSF